MGISGCNLGVTVPEDVLHQSQVLGFLVKIGAAAVAENMAGARNVYVVGFQGSAFLAEFTAYYLSKVRPNVHRVNEWENSFFSLLTEDGQEQDVALIYAFPRFPMLTERLVRFFKQRGVQMIAISTV